MCNTSEVVKDAMRIVSKDVQAPFCVRKGLVKPKQSKWHPVEFAGIWILMDSPYYDANDVLNADNIGEYKARKNAELAAKAPQMLEEIKELKKQIKTLKGKINGKSSRRSAG